MKPFLTGILAALSIVAADARADERILDFHSEITIAADASMDVGETIRVRAEGAQIRHGIYRDFPTDYRDRYGNRVRVDFEPIGVTRDGHDEAFRTEGRSNGVRVYFGDKDSVLAPGEYTYVIRYTTRRQLGFFDDHDELYWNVTGNGWDFPIDVASASVTLPGTVSAGSIHVEGYTGAQGSKAQDYRAAADADSHATIRTTRALAPREGLTAVVGFPKGIVAAPGDAQRARWFLADNGGVLVGGIGLAVLWMYYLWQWLRVGRDPKPGVIFPRYEAPPDCTPGMLRHVERMAYDDRCFAADLVDLGVRGAVAIEQQSGTFTVRRTSSGRASPPAIEASLLQALLGSRPTLELAQSQHTIVGAALKAHRAALEQADLGRYFLTNSKRVWPGVLIAIAALLAGLFAHGASPMLAGAGFMLVWLGGWSVGVVLLVIGVIKAWRGKPGVSTYFNALFLTLFALPFVAGEIVGFGLFASFTGIGFAVVALALMLTHVLFFHWLKAPTQEGRKLLDHIAGLRLYLGVAERDALAAQQAPPMSVDEFQRFLPYALALDVEKTWADRFAAAVGPAAAAAAASSMLWYQGGTAASGLAGFADSLGSSLSGAISSSSSAPGSSSGSGGGGSSGGGGGGGGGGGW